MLGATAVTKDHGRAHAVMLAVGAESAQLPAESAPALSLVTAPKRVAACLGTLLSLWLMASAGAAHKKLVLCAADNGALQCPLHVQLCG
jgi:hypothetical protein